MNEAQKKISFLWKNQYVMNTISRSEIIEGRDNLVQFFQLHHPLSFTQSQQLPRKREKK
jgi:hypothetical protein